MDVEAFAQRLIAARQSGARIASLDRNEAPASAAEGYAVQEAILKQLGIGIAAWKAGASSPTAEPQAAPILADRSKPSPARFALPSFALRTVECELAFSFARDLPKRATPYSEAEVLDAIDAMHVAIEILESAFI